MGTKKSHLLVRILYFLLLLPAYFKYAFPRRKTEEYIDTSILKLEEYYHSPQMRVVRFKAKCALKKDFYQQEIAQLTKELEIQDKNYRKQEIGTETKKEIQDVIIALKEKIERKNIKFSFYQECVEKLKAIESQIQVKESLLISKRKMLEMQDLEVEQSIKKQVEEEFELFESYGNLLDGISNNLKKLRNEKEGLFDLVEVKQMEEEFKDSKNIGT